MSKENRGRELELRMQAAELRSDLPELDLHGLRLLNALKAVDVFLDNARADEDAVRIVYGIGEGTLKEGVLAHINKHPDVALVKEDERRARCIVLLR